MGGSDLKFGCSYIRWTEEGVYLYIMSPSSTMYVLVLSVREFCYFVLKSISYKGYIYLYRCVLPHVYWNAHHWPVVIDDQLYCTAIHSNMFGVIQFMWRMDHFQFKSIIWLLLIHCWSQDMLEVVSCLRVYKARVLLEEIILNTLTDLIYTYIMPGYQGTWYSNLIVVLMICKRSWSGAGFVHGASKLLVH